MTDDISIALSWIANYSNFYSVLSVILFFCIMVVFILGLNGGEDFMTSTATHYNVAQEQKMISLTNPFSVKLDPEKSCSLTSGLHITLSATSESKAQVFWGVNIQSFQQELQLPVDDIASRYVSGDIFNNEYMHADHHVVLSSDESNIKSNSLQTPSSLTEEVLGQPPRNLYPTVVAMMLTDHNISLDYTAIVLQLTVIHLKDSLCSLDSHIVYQFVKTNHSSIISLQPIFLSASNTDYYNQRPSSSENPPTNVPAEPISTQEDLGDNNIDRESKLDAEIDADDACCVCQTAAIYYTLLPCRHACVCSSCIKLLDRCPMCRGYIDAYFRLGGSEQYAGSLDSEVMEPRPANIWQRFNQRVNEMLGLV